MALISSGCGLPAAKSELSHCRRYGGLDNQLKVIRGDYMKGEIDKDFYCSAGFYQAVPNSEMGYCLMLKGSCGRICPAYQRKWPTPEQFREKWGEDYPDDGAVYVLTFGSKWEVYRYDTFKSEDMLIVCACTHWRKPPADWRPE